MYWLAGARDSITQQTVVNLPYIVAEALLDFSPWMNLIILLKNTVTNDWMHLNRNWGARWAEWLFITPRFHHIHHSDIPEHYRGNMGVILSVWDHLFGTYVDPQSVKEKLRFGIGERVPAARLLVGV